MDIEKIKIDLAHAKLLYGLVVSFKPKRILEFGFGGGASSNAILEGIEFNQNSPSYTLVDSWLDFQGIPQKISERINVITSTEKDFVKSSKENYDFIFSDADHHHSNEWFNETYTNLLATLGILIYHDVTSPDFPNLKTIYDKAITQNLSCYLFNKSSRKDERCERGLLVIFKSSNW